MSKHAKVSAYLSLLVLLVASTSHSQSLPTRSERLYHLAKVWGYVKYFHPGANGCSNNIDEVLIGSIGVADTATTYETFEHALLRLFDHAGPVPVATTPEVLVDTLNKLNLDLRWHHEPALPLSIRIRLDSVRVNFRPYRNCYFLRGANETVYLIDEKNYTAGLATRPDHALLLLFRAWNIHNYFSPYRRLLGAAWDSTLVQLIPVFSQVTSELDLHLAFARYQALQLDAHSSANSIKLTEHFGANYLPAILKVVQGETVVSKVFADAGDLRVGDVIRSIDGTPVDLLRDSLRPYAHGAAKEIVDRNISTYLLRGRNTTCTLTAENAEGTRTIEIERSATASQSTDSLIRPRGDGSVWKILPGNIGYVNVGLLTVAKVSEMYDDLRDTRALVFDMRNYPGEFVIYDVAEKILPSQRAFSYFYFPEPDHPGTFQGLDLYCGPSVSNPDHYKGQIRILQNEVTQSQAEFTIMAWQTHPNAKIVGSQTAGADGNVTTLTFPTNLTLRYSGCGVLYPDRRETQIIGIEEDITVQPTIAGIREGRDEVLEAAIASLSSGGVEESGDHALAAFVDSAGMLTLHNAESGTLKIFDLLGRQVFEGRHLGSTIDISHLPTGTYLTELTGQNTVWRGHINR